MRLKDYLVLLIGAFFFFVVGSYIMYALAYLLPISLVINFPVIKAISIIAMIFGLILCIWANYDLIVYGKGAGAVIGRYEFTPQTKFLVTKGAYSLSRNPMHLGIFVYYVGFSLYLNSLSAFIIPILMLIFAYVFAIFIDEPRLKRDFKEQYEQWAGTVPRFFPKIR